MNRIIESIKMKIDVLNESKFPRISNNHRGRMMKKLSVPNYENNNVKNNATASKNTCGRISFKGTLAGEAAKKSSKALDFIADSIIKSDKIQSFLNFAHDNNLLASSIIALFVTCIMRPVTIMSMPTKSEENKEKNKYASAKSIASGVIGFIATYLIAEPFKHATKQVSKELIEAGKIIAEDDIKPTARSLAQSILDKVSPPCFLNTNEKLVEAARKMIPEDYINKILKKAGKFPTNNAENLKNSIGALTEILANRLRSQKSITEQFLNATSHTPLSVPIKALATISLVPIFLGIFGLKKSSDKKPKVETKQNITLPPQYRNDIRPVFKNIAMTGGAK